MARLKEAAFRLIADEEGATMVEYALLVALIALIAMAGVGLLGENANARFEEAADTIGG